MKNTILISTMALCMFFASAAMADSGAVTAMVDTVMTGEEGSSITAIDDYGVSIIFSLTPKTTVTGPDDETIDLGDIKQNDTVEIKYESLEGGVGIAESIKKVSY